MKRPPGPAIPTMYITTDLALIAYVGFASGLVDTPVQAPLPPANFFFGLTMG